MCMCGGLMGMPVAIDVEPGDVILLEAGCGRPKSKNDRVCVIASVNGASALTADGVQIACFDSFEKKGHTSSYPLTDLAIKKAKRVGVDLVEMEDLVEQELVTETAV